MLDEIGIGGQRLRMVNTSSAQGAQFAEACAEMTRAVQELGPSPLRKKPSAVSSLPSTEPFQPAVEVTS